MDIESTSELKKRLIFLNQNSIENSPFPKYLVCNSILKNLEQFVSTITSNMGSNYSWWFTSFEAMGFSFIALQGFDLIAAVGGEIRNPARNIPRAMVLSLIIALLIYLPLLFVSVMTFILIISSVTMVLAVHAGHKGDKQGVVKWIAWTIVGGLAFLGCQAWEWHHLITGEHAVLMDGQLNIIGQTTSVNPWGDLVSNEAAIAALSKTPHETLVSLAHLSDHNMTHEAAAKLSHDDLMKTISSNIDALHIRKNGPVAFGGYFYGITGFHGFHVFSGVLINIVMLIMAQKDVFTKRGHYLMIEKAGLYWHFVDLVWVFVFLCFYLI